MSDAVYGLIGVLGGSLVTAAVAYWGPLHQQREVARQAESQQHADMRRAEMEIEAARAQAEEARRHVRNQAEIGRLVDVRSTLRSWQLVLDVALAEMQLAGALNLDRFRDQEHQAMTKSLRALDEVMHDHWYVRISQYGDETSPPTHRSSPHGPLVEALQEYAARIRELGLARRPPSLGEKEELEELRAHVVQERGRISEMVEERLESIVR